MNYKIKQKLRNISHQNKIFKKIYKISNVLKVSALSILPDEIYAQYKFRENTGRKLNIKKPITFNEKLWWLKLHNRDPLLTTCSDKILVRNYIEKKGLGFILNRLISVHNSPEEIDFKKLPSKAYIKVNHSSGTNFFWNNQSKTVLNRKKFNEKFNEALNSNYYLQSREYNYKDINPRILIEEFIEDKSELGLIDYRFFCFNGKVEIVQVDIDVAANDGTHNPYSRRNIYDRNFILQKNVKAKRENFNPGLVKMPINFNEMVKYAEILSNPFIFCRIDLYNIDGKIYFGEITFYPGGGTQIFEPYSWEYKLGEKINLKSSKIVTEIKHVSKG